MKLKTLYWLKIHRMADEGGDTPAGGGGSLLPEAGSTPPADPPHGETPPGDAPPAGGEQDWFKKDKYKTVEDQAKAYNELEKKLGEKNEIIGAPKDGKYELTMPEGIDGKFIDGDPLMAKFQSTAKELNLSQKAFDSILHSYLQAEAESIATSKESEIKALGDNADRRLEALGQWGSKNLDAEAYETFRGTASTAAGVKMLEEMINNTRDHTLRNQDQHHNANGMTPDKLREMANKKDANGNRLASVDPAYKKQVDQAYRDYYGDEPKVTIVG